MLEIIIRIITKYWWAILLILYFGILLYRVKNIVPTNGFSIAEVSLVVASVQTLVQNSKTINRLCLMVYFFFMNIQFRLKYKASYKIQSDILCRLNDDFWVKLTRDVINVNPKLQGQDSEVKLFKGRGGLETLITFMPLGINMKITKDSSDLLEEDDDYITLNVVGDVHMKYRDAKIMLDDFITCFFSNLEEKIGKMLFKKYILEISSVENDRDYFKRLFIKGMESNEIQNFMLQNKPGRYTINASHKRVYLASNFRDDIVKTTKNMLFKLKM